MRNIFCDSNSLHNEADVEQNFARRLIERLGYPDRDIRPKTALERLSRGRVETSRSYKPDFAMKVAGHIRWILEAKGPSEHLDNHFDQVNNYCDTINDSYTGVGPVEYFILTNSIDTWVYRSGRSEPFLRLTFNHFAETNQDFRTLVAMLSPDAFGRENPNANREQLINFTKPTIPEVNAVFAKCHQYIHQSDKMSQAKGFEEFVKLIALKLLSDKEIRDAYPGLRAERSFFIPAGQVKFSSHWIANQEASATNPVDQILFHDFMNEVERQIARRIRKRFFDEGAKIELKSTTIRGVVERLEHLYLFGIDADLNGRLFENFLSATMRGKDLGQYFTPRTIVKLGVGLANLKRTDLVLDGCCGTGGFLIDALADMWSKVNNNPSLSTTEKARQRQHIADDQIYGVDFAKSPNLAKIARLNMYLHGDGGSRIFNIDALDLEIEDDVNDSPEEAAEKSEVRTLDLPETFDVVLTNPPFSKTYKNSNPEDARILEQYMVGSQKSNVAAKLMFFEMYYHRLKIGGRLVSVIDDGFLNSASFKWFRDILRSLFIVKAVISLPGDAFQRSDARVKTSVIVLEKRSPSNTLSLSGDPAVFMYACRYVGIDDPKRARWMPGDDELREKARDEVKIVVDHYRSFLDGTGLPEYEVPVQRTENRLDVKHCLTQPNWDMARSETVITDVLRLKSFVEADIVECATHSGPVQLFTVKYDGTPLPGRTIFPRSETEYSQLYRVRSGDIVMSNIAATYGSVAIVPPEMDGLVVSKEYTVLRTNLDYDARVVWAVLRSPAVRAELLLRTTGANRTRISWSQMADIRFPYPEKEIADKIISHLEAAELAQKTETRERSMAIESLNDSLDLEQEDAFHILDAYKPPR